MVLTGSSSIQWIKEEQRSNVPIIFVVLIIAALHFYEIGIVQIGEVKAAPWDFATIALCIIWTLYMLRKSPSTDQFFTAALFMSILFTLWVGVEALRSPQEERGLTMFLLQIRNIIIFVMIGTTMPTLRNMHRLNMVLFLLGTLVAAISVPMFSLELRNVPKILATPSLWHTGTYTLNQNVIRLSGFAGDPNFYSLWLSLSFFVGFSFLLTPSKWFAIILMGLSLLLAVSRTFFIMLAVSTMMLMVLVFLYRRWNRRSNPYFKRMLIGTVLVATTGFIWSTFQSNIWEALQRRFGVSSPRFGMWNTLLQQGFDDVVFGTGLRGAETILHGLYSHNSYLDLLVETGVIGFLLWLCVALFVSFVAVRRLHQRAFTPWIHTWFLLLGMFFAFSLVYSPFFWVIAAVIVSSPRYEERPV